MTRENKLALVVGFGLILFVGILISDHFSTARLQQAAIFTDSGVVDPMTGAMAQNSNLVEMVPLPPTPAVSTTDRPVISMNETPRPEQATSVYDGALAERPVQQQPEVRQITADTATLDPNVFVSVGPEAKPIKAVHALHDVKSGETFFKICRQYYGDSSLAGALAKFNQIDDPASLREGRKLQIPPAELIGGKSTVNPTTDPAASNPPSLRISRPSTVIVTNISAKPNTGPGNGAAAPSGRKNASSKSYTVKSGDTLATIAHRQLGSKSKWKKIYDMNRDVIDDPDNVRVGTVLKLL